MDPLSQFRNVIQADSWQPPDVWHAEVVANNGNGMININTPWSDGMQNVPVVLGMENVGIGENIACTYLNNDLQSPLGIGQQGINVPSNIAAGGGGITINLYPDEWPYERGGNNGDSLTVLVQGNGSGQFPLTFVSTAGVDGAYVNGGPGLSSPHTGITAMRGCNLGVVYTRSDSTVWACSYSQAVQLQFDLQFGNTSGQIVGLAAIDAITMTGNVSTITGTNIIYTDAGNFYVTNYQYPSNGNNTTNTNIGNITQYSAGFGGGDYPIGDPLFHPDGTIYVLMGNGENYRIDQYNLTAGLISSTALDYSTTAPAPVLVVWEDGTPASNFGHIGTLTGDNRGGLLLLPVVTVTGNVSTLHNWIVPCPILPSGSLDGVGPWCPNNVTIAWDPITKSNAWKHEGSTNAAPPYAAYVPYMVVGDKVFCTYTKQTGVASNYGCPEESPDYLLFGSSIGNTSNHSAFTTYLNLIGSYTIPGYLPTSSEVGIAYLKGQDGTLLHNTPSTSITTLNGTNQIFKALGGLHWVAKSPTVHTSTGSTSTSGFFIVPPDTTFGDSLVQSNGASYFIPSNGAPESDRPGIVSPPPFAFFPPFPLPPYPLGYTVACEWTGLYMTAANATITVALPETSKNPDIYATNGNIIVRSWAAQPIDPVTGNSTAQKVIVYSASDLTKIAEVAVPTTPNPVTSVDALNQPFPGSYIIDLGGVLGNETEHGRQAIIKPVARGDDGFYFSQTYNSLSAADWYYLNSLLQMKTGNLWAEVGGDSTPCPSLQMASGNKLWGWANTQYYTGNSTANGGSLVINLSTNLS